MCCARAEVDTLPWLWQFSKPVEDHATDRLGRLLAKVNTQQVLERHDRQAAAAGHAAVRLPLPFDVGRTRIVADLANQSRKQVRQRDKPDRLQSGTPDHREMRRTRAEAPQQLQRRRLRQHLEHGTRKLAQVARRMPVEAAEQQALHIDHAEHPVAAFVEQRIPTVAALCRQRHWPHQVRRGQLPELERVRQRAQFVARELPVRTARAHDQLQFVTAIGGFGVARAGQPEPREHPVRAEIEQRDGRVHHPVKQVQRHGSQQAGSLCHADRQRLRRKLARHDMQERDDEECQRERYRIGERRRDAQHAEQGCEQMSKGRLPKPAQAERRKRDAKLARRQVSVQVRVHARQYAAPPAVMPRNGRDPRAAQPD
ncbi:hypothetical protein DFQ30_007465 [Apophysomyces sp. BC1015]|nr:hypothetical protein DFQ30_007465 [Apophysomyces sp. BC1015]